MAAAKNVKNRPFCQVTKYLFLVSNKKLVCVLASESTRGKKLLITLELTITSLCKIGFCQAAALRNEIT